MCGFTDDIIDISDQKFSGFAVGYRGQVSFVFLQTDKWRISIENSTTQVLNIWDKNFSEVRYKGLKYYPTYRTYSGLDCDNCTNQRGEDMSTSADYTHGLQITYYFR